MSQTLPLTTWFLSTSFLAGVIFLCAGQANSPTLMAYIAVFAGMGLVTAVLTDPSQDRERRMPGPEERHPNSRKGATALFLVTVIVAALDPGRFHWLQPVSGTTRASALGVLMLAAALQVWAMAANPFFSTAIRIQRDRGHRLMTRGPYRFIRHPGYLAMMIVVPATALAIGSLVALVPALSYSAVILWRVQREEGFLTENLPSYSKYAESVRHRLIPGLW